MAFSRADMVQQTTTTTGTGTLNLDGSVTKYRDFINSDQVTGSTVRFKVDDRAGIWEVVEGIVTTGSPPTLTKVTLLSSSTGSFINWGAGTKYVTQVLTADEADSFLESADIGATVQAYDADLTTWAGITPGANVGTFLATPSSANLAAAVTGETGSGALVFGTSPALTTPNIGTPSAGTLTSCTGLPISTGVSGLGTNVATFLATPSSTNLASAVTGETGTGALVFGTDPALTAPVLTGTVVEDVYAWAQTSGAVTTSCDPANGSIQTVTLTGNVTSITDNFAAGEAITLMIDDGTARTITWPTMTWVNNGGAAPTLATTGYTVVTLWKVSTTLYGALVGDGT